MSSPELRRRCELLLDEVIGAEDSAEAIDAMVAVFTEVQDAARAELADAGGIEAANLRRLLVRRGVPEADHNGVRRSTIAMVEEILTNLGAGR